MIRIGIVAGEASGDLLGAQLIKDLKAERADVEVVGIGGRLMIEQGCNSLFGMERLSVVGIVEVFGRFLELLGMRKKLIQYFLDNPPDVFIGIDAPDFNLTLEETLRRNGIKTVHYVSPSVWAWRENRLKKIARAIDLMLVLFPFELPYYEKKHIPARFVGHPLAAQLRDMADKHETRRKLGLPLDKTLVALMPGSRKGELKQHAAIFLEAALLCQKQHKDLHFVSNLIDDDAKYYLEQLINEICPELPISIFVNDSRQVMQASDVLLLASGTITLEAMLLKKPMVVAYKVSWFTYQIFSRLVRVPYAALPNLLAEKLLVPEYLQYDCTPKKLSDELSNWLGNQTAIEKLQSEFEMIHQNMMQQENHSAAEAVLTLLNKPD